MDAPLRVQLEGGRAVVVGWRRTDGSTLGSLQNVCFTTSPLPVHAFGQPAACARVVRAQMPLAGAPQQGWVQPVPPATAQPSALARTYDFFISNTEVRSSHPQPSLAHGTLLLSGLVGLLSSTLYGRLLAPVGRAVLTQLGCAEIGSSHDAGI